MNLFTKLVIYLFLISSLADSIAISVKDRTERVKHAFLISAGNDLLRIRKQVVQPGWTPDQGFGALFQDFTVHVTDKKLQETEAIREDINDTVQDGTHAVELDEGDFKEAEKESAPEPESAPALEPAPETAPKPAPAPAPEPKPATKPKPAARPEHAPEPKPASPKQKPKSEPKKPSKLKSHTSNKTPKKILKICKDESTSPFCVWLKKFRVSRS